MQSSKSILLALVVLLAACGEPERLRPLTAGDVVLAFGDSLTVGIGTAPEHSYPAVLDGMLPATVVGSGVSGETTAQGLARLPAVLERYRPRLLILLEGGNDILRSVPATQTRDNLAAMIELAQQRGIDVVLLGVPEKKLFSSAAPFYAELAQRYDLVFVEDLVSDLLRSPGRKSDAIHLNAAGYRALAEGVAELLDDNGAF